MNTLLEQSTNVWAAVRQTIAESIRPEGPLAHIREFIPGRRLRSVRQNNPSLYALSRITRVTEWGANRGVAELAITFGVTHTTLRPEDISPQLEDLMNLLVTIFMHLPNLGEADDVRVEEVNPDDAPFGPEDTQPWATATLVWVFQFIQPEGSG